MPFVLLLLGILLLVVSIQGTQGGFYALLKSEFTGSNSFVIWVSALVILGLLGYIRPIRPVTHALLLLVLIVIVLVNGKGFFSQFNQAIRNPIAPTSTPVQPQTFAGAVATSPVPYEPSTGQLASPLATSVLPN